MGHRRMFGAGFGVGLVVAWVWRTTFRSSPRGLETSRPGAVQIDPIPTRGSRWVEFDVEPLFASSEPVDQEYLIDLTESSGTESERPF